MRRRRLSADALQAVLELPVDIILVGVRRAARTLDSRGRGGGSAHHPPHVRRDLDERAPRRSGQTAEGFVDRRRRPPRQGGGRRHAW